MFLTSGCCKKKCSNVHFTLPYCWQFKPLNNKDWCNFDKADSCDIEKHFCDVNCQDVQMTISTQVTGCAHSRYADISDLNCNFFRWVFYSFALKFRLSFRYVKMMLRWQKYDLRHEQDPNRIFVWILSTKSIIKPQAYNKFIVSFRNNNNLETTNKSSSKRKSVRKVLCHKGPLFKT